MNLPFGGLSYWRDGLVAQSDLTQELYGRQVEHLRGQGLGQHRQCIHADCPICAENRKVNREKEIDRAKKLDTEVREKKQEYKNRCAEYMKKFRVVRERLK